MFDFQYSQVTGYAEAQKLVLERSFDMISVAMANKDITVMEALRQDVKSAFDFTIEVINNRYDYLTWLAGSNYINRTSKMVKLDTTGEFKKLIERIELLDAQTYYHSDVVPLFTTSVTDLVKGRELFLIELDEAIAELRKAV